MIVAWVLWNGAPRLAYRLLPGYCVCGVQWHQEMTTAHVCRKCKRTG